MGFVDLYETVLDVAGLSLPPGETFNSVSLSPYFLDPDQTSVRPFAFTEVFDPNFDPDVGPDYESGQRAVRNHTWKFVRSFSGAQALFNLVEHPWEDENELLNPLDPDEQAAFEALEQELDDIVGVCSLSVEGQFCTSSEDCCCGVCQGPTGQATCRSVL